MDHSIVARIRAREAEMLEALGRIVRAESPSNDPALGARCAGVIGDITASLIGAPEVIEVDGVTHLRWSFGEPRVLLLGHFDTVWPSGTLARWDYEVRDGKASGPGIFDMKAGIVQGLYALSTVDELDGVELLLTGDEEIGSGTSRGLIEEAAGRVKAVLVLEPSAAGALKIARKGTASYRVRAIGRAAHAGLEPENGVNAILELCHQGLAIAALARPALGTTVTPTIIAGGSAKNTVPGLAELVVDVRISTEDEQLRIEASMQGLQPQLDGARLSLEGGFDRPPLPRSASHDLFARAREIARALGLGEIEGVEVGGGSDGNITAAVGTPTLDGLGPVGGGAHAEGEWVDVSAMAERSALVAALIEELR